MNNRGGLIIKKFGIIWQLICTAGYFFGSLVWHTDYYINAKECPDTMYPFGLAIFFLRLIFSISNNFFSIY